MRAAKVAVRLPDKRQFYDTGLDLVQARWDNGDYDIQFI